MSIQKQTFAWTQPEAAPPGKYVSFAQVFEHENGVEIALRNNDNMQVSVVLPFDAAEILANVLASARPKKVVPEGHCEICGHPMPEGEKMFRFHGYTGPCPTGGAAS